MRQGRTHTWRGDRSARLRRRHATAATVAASALVLVACGGTPSPTVDDDPTTPAAAPDATPALQDRECPDHFATRTYDPPPEEQPAPDPAITQIDPVDDLPTGDDPDGPDDREGRDGEVVLEPGQDRMGAAEAWARQEAPEHFAGIWLDNEHGATVIAFTQDVDGYAEQVRELFGDGWWVVHGEHAYAEMERVQQEVMRDESWGRGADGPETPPGTITGTGLRIQQVSVDVVGGDDEALAALGDRLDHPAICFEVEGPPPEPDLDGPIRTLATVEGWRTDFGLGVDERLEVAYDRATGERAFADNVPDGLPDGDGDPWRDALHAEFDTVDWDREVVVVWHGGRSSSCPSWVTDVRTEDGAVRVAQASPSAGVCTADFAPFRVVLAVPREVVPAADELPVPLNPRDDLDDVDDPDRPTHEAVPYPAD